jgi:DNA-binding transcriptional LysR family regulator
MMLSYEHMLTFAAVAKHGSFSKAAAEIFRTQSAVSIQVAKLEETLGRRLFDRTTKHIELTEAGHVLLRYVQQIDGLMQQAVQELDDLDQLARGRLVLCTSDTTGCYRLPAVLQRYRERHPGVDIVVRNATSPRTIQAVMEHQVDLGIVTLSGLPAGLEAVPLFARHDVLICHPQHPLATRRAVRLKDLERYALILLDQHCSSRRLLDELCALAKVQLPVSMELSSIEVIKRFVCIDAGLSIVPAVAVHEEVKAGILAAVEISDVQDHPAVKMGAVYKRGKYLSRAASSFLDALREYFGRA